MWFIFGDVLKFICVYWTNLLNKCFDNSLRWTWERCVSDSVSSVFVFPLFWSLPRASANEGPWNSGLSITDRNWLRLEEHQETSQLSALWETWRQTEGCGGWFYKTDKNVCLPFLFLHPSFIPSPYAAPDASSHKRLKDRKLQQAEEEDTTSGREKNWEDVQEFYFHQKTQLWDKSNM